MAAGHTSGKVLLTSFHYNPDNSGLVGREFVPKHARQCNCLDWNLNDNNLVFIFDSNFMTSFVNNILNVLNCNSVKRRF